MHLKERATISTLNGFPDAAMNTFLRYLREAASFDDRTHAGWLNSNPGGVGKDIEHNRK
jgi:hypothetical protein